MSDASVDRTAARRYADALFGRAPDGALVEVRFRMPSGMGQRFHSAVSRGRLVESILALSKRTDVYVGVLPRRRPGGCDRAGRCGVGRLRHLRVGWGAASVPTPAGDGRGVKRREPPCVLILTETVSVDVVERLNRRIALVLGADVRCSDRARILRPAGSVNRKRTEPEAVRLLHLAPAGRVSAAELDRVLPPEPVAVQTVSRPSRRSRIALGDPLELIPPPVYVEQLTGQRVGRSGKIRCPFHEDRTPSMHVYDDPERGWYCFGCGRGGTIYDLASLLLRRETHGREFIELRRELRALVS